MHVFRTVLFPNLASTHEGAPLPDAWGSGGLEGAVEVGDEGSEGAERGTVGEGGRKGGGALLRWVCRQRAKLR